MLSSMKIFGLGLFNAKSDAPKSDAPAKVDPGWQETQARLKQKLDQHASDESENKNRTAQTVSELYPDKAKPEPPKPSGDAWLAKYPAAIYMPGEAHIYALNRRTVERICRHFTDAEKTRLADGDFLFFADEKARLQALGSQWDKWWKALESATHTSVVERLQAIAMENERKQREGQEVERVPHKADLLIEAQQFRRQASENLTMISRQALPIYIPICNRFEAAARRCADLMDAAERQQADEFGVPFTPSATLRFIVWIAAVGAQWPVKTRHHGPCGGNPWESLWGIFNPRK
jgi:hypothetical protein